MGNSLRCCLACVLPCGALDLIRIVHINGHVEEYGRPVAAKEILEANPNHVISKPCMQGVSQHGRIVIVSPDSELKRGIYFLIPASALPEKKQKKRTKRQKRMSLTQSSATTTKVLDQDDQDIQVTEEVPSEEKTKKRHHRRRVAAAAWRPRLESIYED